MVDSSNINQQLYPKFNELLIKRLALCFGVALGIFPRDTINFFRWYNFSKTDKGVNCALEFVEEEKAKDEVKSTIPVALSVIPGRNSFH